MPWQRKTITVGGVPVIAEVRGTGAQIEATVPFGAGTTPAALDPHGTVVVDRAHYTVINRRDPGNRHEILELTLAARDTAAVAATPGERRSRPKSKAARVAAIAAAIATLDAAGAEPWRRDGAPDASALKDRLGWNPAAAEIEAAEAAGA